MKKILLLIIVFTLGTALLVGCGGSKNSVPSTKPSQNPALTVAKGSIGETVTLLSDTAITVKKVLKNPEDSKMLLAEVEIKNISDTPKIYSPQNFILKDKSGNNYPPAIAKVPGPIITTNVLPGKTLSGYLGFTVPSGENDFMLIYRGATGNIEIELSTGE